MSVRKLQTCISNNKIRWIGGKTNTFPNSQRTIPIVKRRPTRTSIIGFYMFQMHQLRQVYANPHPANFLIDKEAQLMPIDFDCIKKVPSEFYIPYFELASPKLFLDKLYGLEILRNDDPKEEVECFSKLFYRLLSLFTKPFHTDHFDFSDEDFFGRLRLWEKSLPKTHSCAK